MKTQFTPGPWEPEYKSAYQHNVVSHTTPKTIVCTCGVPEYGSKMANFTLIAAAPDLFEALHDALIYVTDCIDCCEDKKLVAAAKKHEQKILSALAKARGDK